MIAGCDTLRLMPTSRDPGSVTSRSRCVILHAPGSAVPPELTTGLERRQVEMTFCTSAYEAMARACLLERENDRIEDAESRDALVMLLVAPEKLPHAADLVNALKRHAPRTACWCYVPGANLRLRAVVDDDVAAWQVNRNPAPGWSDDPMVIRPSMSPSQDAGGERAHLHLHTEGNRGRDAGASELAGPSASAAAANAGMTETRAAPGRTHLGGSATEKDRGWHTHAETAQRDKIE
jgi:hypothetical protein